MDSAEVNCLFWGEVDSAGVRYKGCILNILKHQKLGLIVRMRMRVVVLLNTLIQK